MRTISKILVCLVVLFTAVNVSAEPLEIAQTGKQKCLYTCIEQYGADKKQACALQCGLGGGNAAGRPAKDCGTIYKQCLASCGTDKSCKNTCRKQRTECF